jgi:hypothetical protein
VRPDEHLVDRQSLLVGRRLRGVGVDLGHQGQERLVVRAVPRLVQVERPVQRVLLQVGEQRHPPAQERLAVGAAARRGREGICRVVVDVHREGDLLEVVSRLDLLARVAHGEIGQYAAARPAGREHQTQDRAGDRHPPAPQPPPAGADVPQRQDAKDDRGDSRQGAEYQRAEPQDQAGCRLAARPDGRRGVLVGDPDARAAARGGARGPFERLGRLGRLVTLHGVGRPRRRGGRGRLRRGHAERLVAGGAAGGPARLVFLGLELPAAGRAREADHGLSGGEGRQEPAPS